MAELLGALGEGGVHGILERHGGEIGTIRQFLILERAPEPFDVIELGTVRRQKEELDAPGL